jgi:hypothetical protein
VKVLKICLVVALVVAGLFGLMRLRGHHANLRKELAELQRRNRAVESTRSENERLNVLVAQTDPAGADAAEARKLDLERARREVAELEQRAVTRSAEVNTRAAIENDALAANRDPEKGMTRLEHFRNAGRATPSAAIQTLVWASLIGDNQALTGALSVSGAARDKAEALLARLPAAVREKYPSAESLAAIAVTGEMMKGNALELPGYTLADASHSILQIRTQNGKEAKLPMQLGAGGWQLVVPDRAIDAIARRLGDEAVGAPPKP